MVLSTAHPRSRSARRGPAVALAASLLAAGPALCAAQAEGDSSAVAVAPADGAPASLPAPDSLTRARVQARFDDAWRVRVFAGRDPIELSEPRAEAEGVRGISLKERPAVVALDAPASGEKLLRWEDLSRIEVGRPGLARGALIGATAGAVILLTSAFYVDTSTNEDELSQVAQAGMWTLAIGGTLGLIIGAGHPLWMAIPF